MKAAISLLLDYVGTKFYVALISDNITIWQDELVQNPDYLLSSYNQFKRGPNIII